MHDRSESSGSEASLPFNFQKPRVATVVQRIGDKEGYGFGFRVSGFGRVLRVPGQGFASDSGCKGLLTMT